MIPLYYELSPSCCRCGDQNTLWQVQMVELPLSNLHEIGNKEI